MRYVLKHYKALRTGAYTATLWKDGKRYATIEDDGRGGQPNVWPTAKGGTTTDRLAIEAELTEWSKDNVPDWYLTSHGEHERLSPNWELALGYLTECAELNRLGKNGRIVRRADGSLWRAALTTTKAEPGARIWHDGDWVTKVPAGAAA